MDKFGKFSCGIVYCHLLPKNDSRFLVWKESLKGRKPWNAGFTKETHPGLKKLSTTFINKRIDNFSSFRSKTNKLEYKPLVRGKQLAFLIGITLGDGHIHRYNRTESLSLTLAEENPALIVYSASIIEKVFSKEAAVTKNKCKAKTVRIYQKHISKRIKIPAGARGDNTFKVPRWISSNKEFLLGYLKGLFEAEASLSIHLPTYTYNFSFSNTNVSLLDIVENELIKLGFHPERRTDAIRLRRKLEVEQFRDLITFRTYIN